MMRDDLPPGLAPYRRTAVFTEATLPAGLRRAHATAPGVWGAITVLEGRLRYVLEAPHEGERVLDCTTPGIVEPAVRHHVQPLGPGALFRRVPPRRRVSRNGADMALPAARHAMLYVGAGPVVQLVRTDRS